MITNQPFINRPNHSLSQPERSASLGGPRTMELRQGDGLTFVRKKTKDFSPTKQVSETPKKLPSGYDKRFAMERSNMLLSLVNHLFLWAIYTMAMLVITRGSR